MLPLVLAVLTASLLGSAHCAGMCGAFVAFAVGAPGGVSVRVPSRFALNAAYNLGRLATYVTLGAIAGALGAAVDFGGHALGVQRAAAVGAGAIMIGFGVLAILRQLGVRVPRMPVPQLLLRAARAGHARAFDLAPISRAAAVGLLTTLLPCGWLYAFVITASGTASPVFGAITMVAFWLGTLPVMGAIGLGVGSLAPALRRHLPLATSLLLVAVGVWTVMGRMTTPAPCCADADAPTTVTDALRSVRTSHSDCPLCPH